MFSVVTGVQNSNNTKLWLEMPPTCNYNVFLLRYRIMYCVRFTCISLVGMCMQCTVCTVCAADLIHKLFLIITTGLLGFFLVKSQRDQLLFSLSTALDFNRPTLIQGGWALSDGYIYVVWVWVYSTCVGVSVSYNYMCFYLFYCKCVGVCEIRLH